MTEPVDMSGWPASLIEIAELIGPAKALALAYQFCGQEISVPKKVRPGHRLVRVLGVEAFEALAKRYGGRQLPVPTMFAAHAKKRHILQATGSAQEVAARFNVTARYVRYLRSDGPDPRQIPLFD